MNRIPDRERILREIEEERARHISDAEREQLLAFKLTFDSPHGRIVLKDLELSYGGISFTPGYPDVSAFKEGRRSVLDDVRGILKRAEELKVMPPSPNQGG